MLPEHIFYPVIAQAALTGLVLISLLLSRARELRKRRIHIAKLSGSEEFRETMAVNVSDNFENLFEVPILFYVAVLTVYVLKITDEWFLNALWAYVGFRALHSLIHCTYNRVLHRLLAFAASNVILITIWIRIFSAIQNGR